MDREGAPSRTPWRQLPNTGSDKELATPWYSDQILPFDITLTGANEYGAMCVAKIFGVEILNEGSGISIDDAVTEMSTTFVARTVEPMPAGCAQPRDLRPLPCFGTIEKHYRPHWAYSGYEPLVSICCCHDPSLFPDLCPCPV
jgi:hypothetical protein